MKQSTEITLEANLRICAQVPRNTIMGRLVDFFEKTTAATAATTAATTTTAAATVTTKTTAATSPTTEGIRYNNDDEDDNEEEEEKEEEEEGSGKGDSSHSTTGSGDDISATTEGEETETGYSLFTTRASCYNFEAFLSNPFLHVCGFSVMLHASSACIIKGYPRNT